MPKTAGAARHKEKTPAEERSILKIIFASLSLQRGIFRPFLKIFKKEGTYHAKVELKQPIVEEIKASLDGAKGVVLVDHRGLTVEQDTVLRKSLREAGVTYKVYKNTLVKRAIEGTEFESLKDLLEGPSAIAISKSEATTPASIICKFAKTNDKLEVKGGVVEGAFYDAKGVEVLSTIPSREELLAKFLGSIQSPITNFARVIKQIAEKQEA